MNRSTTFTNLRDSAFAQNWQNNPIYAGSVYIKPVKETESNYCGWLYYFCCCGFI